MGNIVAFSSNLEERRRAVVQVYLELAFADIVRRLEGGWVSQKFSPLGPRRHVAAVKRRVAAWLAAGAPAGKNDAGCCGDKHLLTIDALVEEYFAPLDEKHFSRRPANRAQ